MTDNLQEFKVSPELKSKIIENSILKRFKAGDVILNENASIGSIPIVAKGTIKVLRSDEDGKEILLYYLKPGDSCVMSFLGGLHNETSKVRAEAEEDAEIYFLPMNKVILFMKEYPQWIEYLFRLYHKRFEELLEVVNAIAFKKVDERLLLLLKKKSELQGTHVIQISHEQLASELATARVVVSRLLKQMEEEGWLELGRNKITIKKIPRI